MFCNDSESLVGNVVTYMAKKRDINEKVIYLYSYNCFCMLLCICIFFGIQ